MLLSDVVEYWGQEQILIVVELLIVQKASADLYG